MNDDVTSNRALLAEALVEIRRLRAERDDLAWRAREPIAVVGMACRFPGGAATPEAYWKLLAEGGDGIRPILPERWSVERYYAADKDAPGKMYVRSGGFLDAVDRFDPQFFEISPRAAEAMDPQHRLLLEVSWEALEHAGIAPDGLRGSRTGVFMGISFDDYARRTVSSGDASAIDALTSLGASRSVGVGRLSYFLGLEGPCVQLDTSCSSSALAVHLAVQSLRLGECGLALAGGVNLMLSPEPMIALCKMRALAPDGRCKSFDADADGYSRGEGCGVVVLKRLSDAERDGDRILALIRGTASNHDGASNGLTAPNGLAQEAVIRQALENAGVAPGEIDYVEAHGTGTPLGDPIEVLALGRVQGATADRPTPLYIGSVKANIGHLESAAGIAGLIKAVLALQHGAIPSQLHYREPNPHIPWGKLPIAVPTALTPWRAEGRPRRAGVSAFGMSGTNVHVVIEEAPAAATRARGAVRPRHLFCLSAKGPEALRALAGTYRDFIVAHPDAAIEDACFTSGIGRAHFGQRLAIVCSGTADLAEGLGTFAAGGEQAGILSGVRPLQGAPHEAVPLNLPAPGDTVEAWTAALERIGRAYVEGSPVDWDALNEGTGGRRIALPFYAFQRERYWVGTAEAPAGGKTSGAAPHTTTHRPDGPGGPAQQARILGELREIVAGLLHLEPARIDERIPFLEMGADSLVLIEAVSRIEQRYAVKVPIAQLFVQTPDLLSLAGYICEVAAPGKTAEASASSVPAPADAEAMPATDAESGETALERVINQQLALMSKQLDALRARKPGVALGAEGGGPAAESKGARPAEIVSRTKPPAAKTNPLAPQSTSEMRVDSALTPEQYAHVENFTAAYNAAHRKSKDYARRHQTVMADSRRVFGFRRSTKELLYPIVAESARGAYLRDIDGNGYIDLTMGFGALLFGHAPDFVARALVRQQDSGLQLGPQSIHAGEVARLISELTGQERVAFCNSGTEAVMTALRLARAATGRNRIVLFAGSYHGHFDGVLAAAGPDRRGTPLAAGVASKFVEDVLVLDYGAEESLDLLARQAEECAAVLVEPVQSRNPALQPRAFLHRLRTLTRASGTALIFDEVLTGFRAHPGGAQGLFGIDADIAAYGKIIGGGTPIGAVAGKGRFMDGIDGGVWQYGDDSFPAAEKVFFGGTYNKNPTTMAAALAVLTQIRAQGPALQEGLNGTTARLGETLNGYFEAEGFPIRFTHFGSMFRLAFTGNADLLFYHLLNRGLYIWEGRNCFLSTAHGADDLDRVVTVVRESLEEMRAGGFFPRPATAAAAGMREVKVGPAALPRGATGAMAGPALIEERLESSIADLLAEARLESDYAPILLQLDRLATAYVLAALAELGWTLGEPGRIAFSELADRLGIAAKQRRLFRRLLELLAEDGVLKGAGEDWEVLAAAPELQAEPLERAIREQAPLGEAELLLLRRSGRNLARLLRGECHAAEILAPGGDWSATVGLYRDSAIAKATNRIVGNAVAAAIAPVPANRNIRLLEIGAGTGGTTAFILPALAARDVDYDFTDLSPLFVNKARAAFRDFPFVDYRVLDIDAPPDDQGFAPGTYDIAIAANVVHATRDVGRTLDHIRSLLAPGGILLLLETTFRQRWLELIFGLTDGWWNFQDRALRPASPLLPASQWLEVLARHGFAEAVRLPRLRDPAPSVLAKSTVIVGRKAGLGPLSAAQRQLWALAQRSEDGSRAYNLYSNLRLAGVLDAGRLRAAFADVVARHEALRTVITADGEMQVLDTTPGFEPLDLSSESPEKRTRLLDDWLVRQSNAAFDLAGGPLFRAYLVTLEDELHLLHLAAHHIISDGLSFALLLEELSAAYSARCRGAAFEAEPSMQFRDYVALQEAGREREDAREDAAYWLERLEGPSPGLNLPTDHPRPASRSYRAARVTRRLPAVLARALGVLGTGMSATLFMTLLTVFFVLLRRITQQDSLVVGVPASGRAVDGSKSVFGYCTHLLPIKLEDFAAPAFEDFLLRVRDELLEAYAHQDFPFAWLMDRLKASSAAQPAGLVSATFNLDRLAAPLAFGGLRVEILSQPVRFFDFDVSLNVTELPDDTLLVECNYSADLFEPASMARFLDQYQALLEGVVAEPRCRITELPLMNAAERRRVVEEWNSRTLEVPRALCIHQLFETRAARHPRETAVVFENQRLGYGELNRRANQLAHHLRRLGVGPEVLVGICCERSPEMIVAMLATLKAGGAYLPMDPGYPKDRLGFMLADGEAAVLLTQERLLGALPAYGGHIVCLDRDWETIARHGADNPVSHAKPGNLAYVIYTSGSTGRPKGVAIEHRNAMAFLAWVRAFYSDELLRGMLGATSICFDVSILEIFGSLSWGGTLVLVRNVFDLVDLASPVPVTMVCAVPSALQEMLKLGPLPPSVRVANVGGEPVPAHLPELLYRHENIEKVVNGYGPTEDTTYSTIMVIPRGERGNPSIGRPLPNKRLYILDGNFQPVPVGVVGEIYMGGAGVSRGYFKRPELTAERYLANPIPGADGGRLYRIGDLGRFREDGSVEYLGRIDHQVKIRGFRIELGEIEAVLRRHPRVQEAVVLPFTGRLGDKRLAAFVVGRGENPDQSELQEHLAAHVPDYMVPGTIALLDRLPLNPNGKVDRHALSRWDLDGAQERKPSVTAPRDETEAALARIWREVLRLEDREIGVEENFIELGGDSITSLQVVARAKGAGLVLSAQDVFEHKTIEALARVARRVSGEASEAGTVVGAVPLTPIQHWFFERALPSPWHFNQAVLLEVASDIEPTLVERALGALTLHHDALRSRYRRTADGWFQETVEPEADTPLRRIDLSGMDGARRAEALEAEAMRAQGSLDLERGPIWRAVLLTLGASEPARLLLVIHHLVVDGVSWRILLEDFADAYRRLVEGDPVSLPAKTTSFRAWSERLRVWADSGEAAKEEGYWLAQRETATPPLPRDDGTAVNLESGAVDHVVSLDPEGTRALLRETPRAYNTRIDDVLVTALAQAFARWTGHPGLPLDLEGHGREPLFDDLDVTRTVGWFTTLFPVRLEVAEGGPGPALTSIKEQLRRIPRHGIGYGVLRYLSGDAERRSRLAGAPAAEVSFNYLGQFDTLARRAPLLGWAGESSGPAVGADAPRSHLIEIDALIVRDRLELRWRYHRDIHRGATIERLAADVLGALRALIEHCCRAETADYTPSDFSAADLTQIELDAIYAIPESSE
jgi:amino acid adenylation domain-containing protein/non-ribosomal peptide synthase protein (TIGR01720 family)